MVVDLRVIDSTRLEIRALLPQTGRVLREYLEQDSGCVSFVVEDSCGRLFVKAATDDAGAASLGRATAIHSAIRHPALPPLLNTFETPPGPAHVYAWVPGEVLYDYVSMDGERGRLDPASAHARFRTLPVEDILASLDAIYDLHLRIAEAGFVAVDFYDGCILYDFDAHRAWVCDLDEYRPGPFRLMEDRLPGSQRFMAPEESVRGSTIDERTNVYTLGRTAAILLSDGDARSDAWRGSQALRAVVERAAERDPALRFPAVAAFVDAWSAARDW
jgi:serine/threonine protein kinase